MQTPTIFIAGATGSIGHSLLSHLSSKGYFIRALTRDLTQLSTEEKQNSKVEWVSGDLLYEEFPENGLEGIDTCFYFVKISDWRKKKRAYFNEEAARFFKEKLISSSVKKVVILTRQGSGQKNDSVSISQKIAEILRESSVAVTEVQVSVLLGEGTPAFEMVRHFSEKISFGYLPAWTSQRFYPILMSDLLDYLTSLILEKNPPQKVILKGVEKLSYRRLMQRYSEERGLKRRYLKGKNSLVSFSLLSGMFFASLERKKMKFLMEGVSRVSENTKTEEEKGNENEIVLSGSISDFLKRTVKEKRESIDLVAQEINRHFDQVEGEYTVSDEINGIKVKGTQLTFKGAAGLVQRFFDKMEEEQTEFLGLFNSFFQLMGVSSPSDFEFLKGLKGKKYLSKSFFKSKWGDFSLCIDSVPDEKKEGNAKLRLLFFASPKGGRGYFRWKITSFFFSRFLYRLSIALRKNIEEFSRTMEKVQSSQPKKEVFEIAPSHLEPLNS